MLIAVLMTNFVNLFFVVMVVRECAEYLGRRQVIPLGQNLLSRHASLIVIINDMPYSYPCSLKGRLASADTLNLADVRVGSVLYLFIVSGHKATSFIASAIHRFL